MNTKAWLMDDSEPWSTSQGCSLRWGQFDVNGASLCHNSSPIYCSALRAVLHIFYNNVQPFLLLALWYRSFDLSWLRTAPRSCLGHSNRSNPVNQSLFDIFLNRQIGLILRLSFQSFLMCKCRLCDCWYINCCKTFVGSGTFCCCFGWNFFNPLTNLTEASYQLFCITCFCCKSVGFGSTSAAFGLHGVSSICCVPVEFDDPSA